MDKAEKFWNRMSGQYEKRAKHFSKSHIRTVENIKKHLNTGDIVLDYGCATGIIAIEIADNVKKIYGIDISTTMIDTAKKKIEERKIGNIELAKTTIFEAQFEKESFDVVLALDILHLVEDAPAVVKRINELLKPGGMLITATACMGEAYSFISALISLLIKIGLVPEIRYFKNSELKDLITKCNFNIVEAESLNKNNTEYFIAAKKI